MNKDINKAVVQFFTDHIISFRSPSGKIIDQELYSKISELVNWYNETLIDSTYTIVSSDFSHNGGQVTFVDIDNINTDNSLYSGMKKLSGKKYGILIEPENYPYIEPYNRQKPYYIDVSYLDIIQDQPYTNYNLYKVNSYYINVTTQFHKLQYDDIWKMISFDICVLKDNLPKFISSLLKLLDMNEMVNSVLDYLKQN